ncbi:MAG: chromosome segregation protein SMC, partial [Tissierellia bacterium]|nr:chromosome segregation protein SMC [Tissierellia bacterium]
MYLKTIELQGFKSFAEKTKIEFNHSVTGVVGPNGSGKSNISDAIMWALGEQSAKSLRGSKMEDVIFSGTRHRKPLGFAHVVLTFDNSNHWLPLEFKEVTVSRKMYRSGESEFSINKERCRLKDVKELFMDTGIGKDGYSLIGQGKIDSVLSTKPEDRRNIFEEAAGISKYKVKKEEANRKLSSTKENILRLDDILSEIQMQERKLKREVRRFQQYDDVKKKVCYGEWILLQKEMKDFESLKEDLSENIDNGKKKILTYKNKMEKLEEVRRENREAFQKLKGQSHVSNEVFINTRNEYFELVTEEKLIQERLETECLNTKTIVSDIESLKNEIKEIVEEIEKTKEEILINSNEKAHVSGKVSSLYSKKTEIIKKRVDIESKIKELEESYDDVSENLTKQEKALISVTSIQKEKEDRKNQLSSYVKGLQDNAEQLIQEETKELAKKMKLEEQIPPLKSQYIILEDKYKKEEDSLKEFQLKQKDIGLLFSQKQGEYQFYKNAIENLEGFHKSVRSFLNYCRNNHLFSNDIIGPVALNFQVEKEFETAVTVALGYGIQNIIIKEAKASKEMIEILKEKKLGRVTFLPLDIYRNKYRDFKKKSPPKESLGYLVEYIQCEKFLTPIFQGLLGNTILVQTYVDGLKLQQSNTFYGRIISLQGDIFHTQGSITGGSIYQGNKDMVNRQKRLEEEQTQLKNLQKELENYQLKIDNQEKYLKDCSYNINRIKEEMNVLSLEEEKCERKLEQIQLAKESNQEHGKKYFEELDSLSLSLHHDKEKIDELEKYSHDLFLEKKSYTEKLDDYRSYKNKIIKDENEMNERYHQEELTLNSLEGTEKTLYYRELHLEEESKSKKDKLSTWKKNLDLSHKKQRDYQKSLGIMEKSKNEKEGALKELEDIKKNFDFQLETLEKKGYDLEREWNQIQSELYKEEDRLKDFNFKLEKLNLEISHKIETFHDKYGVVNFEDIDITKEDIAQREKELEKNRKKLLSIGAIDPNAPEEYEKVKQRVNFHEQQRNDLLVAEESLQRIILRLDREMKEKFESSFEEISQYFN